MNLEDKFQELKNRGEGAHMPHVYFGDPHEEFSLRLIETLAENGRRHPRVRNPIL